MSVRCKNNRYIIDYYPHGAKGKRVRITLAPKTTEEQARQIEKGLRNLKKENINHLHDDPVFRLAQSYYEYINMHLAPSTCRDIKECFINHIVPFFGNMHISDIITPLISTYQKLRREKPNIRNRKQKAINRSINKELSYFSAFLKWAESETGTTLQSSIRFRAMPYKRPLPNILSQAEINKIIDESEKSYKGLFLTIAHLGLRITSARLLKWSDVDWPSQTIIAHVKGNREILLPLSDSLSSWLRQQQNRNEYNSPWLFPSSIRPLHPISDIRKALRRAVKRAGITKRVHPHLFRHTAGAHLLESGVDIRTVQEILGHSDIRMTEWYTQVVMKMKREGFKKAGYIKSSQRRSQK